jgi:hypothetical protein
MKTFIALLFSYGLVQLFYAVGHQLTNYQFYFMASVFSLATFIFCYVLIDEKKGLKENWRLLLLCALSLIDAFLLASFYISFFFIEILEAQLYLYWEADFSWRVIYSSIELLLMLELTYNGIILLYDFISHSDSRVRKLFI